MIVLFVSLQGLSPMHQAAENEIIRQTLTSGNIPWLLHCGACLKSCSLNSTHNLLGCAICDARSVGLANQSGIPQDRRLAMDRFLSSGTKFEELPEDLEGVLNMELDGINIGRGIASSTISVLREYKLEPRGKHQKLVGLQTQNAVIALRNYQAALDRIKPNKVIIFNGRHAEMWPMLELCRQRKIAYATHERGGSNQLFQVFENSLPHSITTRRMIMKELWKSKPEAERVAEATSWYEVKRLGKHKDDKNYLKQQATGAMPVGYDPEKQNIVIFNSSEDEMQAIAEWKTDLFNQQNEVVFLLLKELEERQDIHVYIRMHPNLTNVDNQQTQELYDLKQENMTLIRPEEKTDTYTLMENADVILTFASSAGVEATFWGTPSVLYGRAFYEGDDAVYEPDSFSDLITLLTQTDLPAKPRANVLKYGYFVSHFGQHYEYAEVRSPNDVDINGKQMGRISWGSFFRMVRYIPYFGGWLSAHRVITGRELRLTDLTKLWSHLRG